MGVSPIQEEINELKNQHNAEFSWLTLQKNVADYTNTSFFALFNTPAIEVLAVADMMLSETELNQLTSNTKTV